MNGTIALWHLNEAGLEFGTGTTQSIDSALFQVNGGEWNHYVAAYAPNVGASIYLNGVRLYSDTVNRGPIVDSSYELFIGRRVGQNFAYWTGLMDEVALWNRALSVQEVLEVYRRGANRIRFQVRSCDDSQCALGPWKGSDGTVTTSSSELNNNTAPMSGAGDVKTGSPSIQIGQFPNAPAPKRYFQYRAIFEGQKGGAMCVYPEATLPCSPELRSVTVGPSHHLGPAMVVNRLGTSVLGLAGLTERLGPGGCPAGIVYQLGRSEAGPWWYWEIGSQRWILGNETDSTATSGAQLASGLSQFVRAVPDGGVFHFRAFLRTDIAGDPCELDALEITGLR